MKKLLNVLLAILFSCLLISCTMTGTTSSETNSDSLTSESVSQSDVSTSVLESECSHSLVLKIATEPTCSKEGNVEYYFCWMCSETFADENAQTPIDVADTKVEKTPHSLEMVEGYEATCTQDGLLEHWACTACQAKFADEDAQTQLNLNQINIPALNHDLTFYEGYPIDGDENGLIDHWQCENCQTYFLDEECTVVSDAEALILRSAVNMPDFVVEVPAGRDPVILQLTDTQIIDGEQSRSEQSSGDKITYATAKIKDYCYDYLTEIITQTNPDLILLTGDIIYGKYDDNGSVLLAFIDFMESFEIPWAPVFGNHDNESKMGADWQCEQLENAEYCLFKQRELTGNGNYSVGIKQNGKITRMFFMLDTNGCNYASDESLANGHTVRSVGFALDQTAWFTSEIEKMIELSPDTKYSFAYHIQQAIFGTAFEKYGFNQSKNDQDILIDSLQDKADGDFGYIGRKMKDPWDTNFNLFEKMKAWGVDSIFVGHEHCNSASVVYQGVRLQYGQKSSLYDRYNCIDSNGNILSTYVYLKDGTPIIGGSVMVISGDDGAIIDSYIYYCENAGGNVDWGNL